MVNRFMALAIFNSPVCQVMQGFELKDSWTLPDPFVTSNPAPRYYHGNNLRHCFEQMISVWE